MALLFFLFIFILLILYINNNSKKYNFNEYLNISNNSNYLDLNTRDLIKDFSILSNNNTNISNYY